MTTKKEILKQINSNPHKAKEALETLYHNRTYAITSYSRVDKFFKTKRGAEGYQKRQSNISWYDDYTQEMTSADTGTVTEIQDREITDPTTDQKIWYRYIKKVWSKNWLLSNVVNEAKNIVIDLDLLEWIETTVLEIQENNYFNIIEKFEEIEDLEKVIGSPEFYAKQERDKNELIQQGIKRIKEAGRINTDDFEDIAYKLSTYGMGFVDAQNQITELYLYQLDQEEKGEEPKTEEKTEITPDTTNTDIEISFNEEKNGIEIKFDGKPSEEIRENLKANGFRWSRYQKIWYAKDIAERREFIKSFDAVETESEPKIFEYPEIEMDDIEDYTIDPDISRRENQGNWIFRSKETDHTQELQKTLHHYQDEAIKIIAKTEDKEIIYKLKRDLQRFKKSYHTNYTKMITNKANNPSWAVTGRAGRNANKDRKANDRYNNLIQESIKIVDDFVSLLGRANNKIRATARKENYKNIENTEIELDFKVETKEIDMAGVKQNLRTYNHKNYMIVKAWGCFRIFKDGKEIKSMRTTDTLKMTKKALQLILNEKENIKQAI